MRTKIMQRWSPRLRRTALVYAFVAAIIAVAALWAAGQNWVAYSLDGQASCAFLPAPSTVRLADGQMASVSAQCNTGWQLVEAGYRSEGSVNPYWLPTDMGMPTVTYATIGLALSTVIGLLLRNALVFVFGLWQGYNLVSAYEPTMQALKGGLVEGQFALQSGWTTAFVCAALIGAVYIGGAVLVASTNHRLRKQILNEAAGKDSLGLISDLRIFARSGMANMVRASSVDHTPT